MGRRDGAAGSLCLSLSRRLSSARMARLASESVRGRTSANSAPPRRSLRPAAIEPLCSTTIFLTIASPRPVPCLLDVKYGSKIRSRDASATPGPSSSTTIATVSWSRPALTITRPRAGAPGTPAPPAVARGPPGPGVFDDDRDGLVVASRPHDHATPGGGARHLGAVDARATNGLDGVAHEVHEIGRASCRG